MRVLLIEDDSATAQSIELMLKSESFNVYTTDLGEEGIDLGKIYDYDIILLDLNLPDMSGFEVLRSLRVSKVKTPILILSGLAGIEDKVRGLGFGADDYMTKPFHKDELVARIHAIVRRSKGHAQSVINTGDLCVNLDTKTVEVNGARVHLTGKEYQMLELLSLRKGTTLTKEMFLNHLYGGMDEPELKIIDVFICKLRKKLANASNGKNYIETVWGRGYVLREPAEDEVKNSGLTNTVRPRRQNPGHWPGFLFVSLNLSAETVAHPGLVGVERLLRPLFVGRHDPFFKRGIDVARIAVIGKATIAVGIAHPCCIAEPDARFTHAGNVLRPK